MLVVSFQPGEVDTQDLSQFLTIAMARGASASHVGQHRFRGHAGELGQESPSTWERILLSIPELLFEVFGPMIDGEIETVGERQAGELSARHGQQHASRSSGWPADTTRGVRSARSGGYEIVMIRRLGRQFDAVRADHHVIAAPAS
jgi:hypothetical protein